jgi:hypothetical protein
MFLSRVHKRPGANPFDQFSNSGFLSLILRLVAIHTECFAACQFVRLACLVEQDLGRVVVARYLKLRSFLRTPVFEDQVEAQCISACSSAREALERLSFPLPGFGSRCHRGYHGYPWLLL